MHEIILEHPDHGSFLFAYIRLKNRRQLIKAMFLNFPKLNKFTGSCDWMLGLLAAEGVLTTNGWAIKFSGRTQKEALIEGELTLYTERIKCTVKN